MSSFENVCDSSVWNIRIILAKFKLEPFDLTKHQGLITATYMPMSLVYSYGIYSYLLNTLVSIST
jgi:hypothetical protein